eukprot:6050413-Prymnesium_polylepis.2
MGARLATTYKDFAADVAAGYEAATPAVKEALRLKNGDLGDVELLPALAPAPAAAAGGSGGGDAAAIAAVPPRARLPAE